MRRFLHLMTIILIAGALAGCYKSKDNLHANWQEFPVSSLFGEGNFVFKSDKSYMFARISKNEAIISYDGMNVNERILPNNVIFFVVKSPNLPVGHFFAVGYSGDTYSYYPFIFYKDGVHTFNWGEVSVKSAAELEERFETARAETLGVLYRKVAPSEARRLFAEKAKLDAERRRRGLE